MSLTHEIVESLRLASCDWRRLNWKDVNALIEKWKDLFAPEVRDKHGKWIYSQFLWHAFSYREAMHLSGAKADLEYTGQQITSYYLVWVDDQHSLDGLIAYSCPLPENDLLSTTVRSVLKTGDLYLIAGDFSWTRVDTHEDGLGPYFAHSRNRGKL